MNNWKSGITVSLVSMPLAISLAVASGVNPLAGIVTAIWAGLIASIFSGSNYNIIGPTGALSGIIGLYALEYGVESISVLAIIAGIFILLAYWLRLERFLVFIPSSVIHGFTLGVAFIIGLNQVNFATGLYNLPKHDKLLENLVESLRHFSQISGYALLLFVLCFSCLVFLRKVIPQVPGMIVLSLIGILLGWLISSGYIPMHIETLGSKFGEISMQLFIYPKMFFAINLIFPAIIIAFIAILETMLSAKIADAMTSTKHNGRKEMFALGLANIASGLMGGIPATAALARTALNIKSGAKNKMSATISSIFIGVWATLFLGYFRFIPMAVIAAILVYVAVNMIEREHFDRLWTHDKTSFGVAMLVAFITVYEDPITGILLGTGLSLLLFVEKLSHGYYETTVPAGIEFNEHAKQILKDRQVVIYAIKGKLVYINSQAHIIRFETDFADYKCIILSLGEVYFIDIDGVDALDDIIDITLSRGQQIFIVGVNSSVKCLLKTTSAHFNECEKKGLVFNNMSEVLHFLEH